MSKENIEVDVKLATYSEVHDNGTQKKTNGVLTSQKSKQNGSEGDKYDQKYESSRNSNSGLPVSLSQNPLAPDSMAINSQGGTQHQHHGSIASKNKSIPTRTSMAIRNTNNPSNKNNTPYKGQNSITKKGISLRSPRASVDGASSVELSGQTQFLKPKATQNLDKVAISHFTNKFSSPKGAQGINGSQSTSF